MLNQAFLSAFAAMLLSATLVQTASALPTTVRSSTTTVTGTYRPINLDLALANDSNNKLEYSSAPYYSAGNASPPNIGGNAVYNPSGNPSGKGPQLISGLRFEALLGGRFSADYPDPQYSKTGPAGNWRLILSEGFDSRVYSDDNNEDTIYLYVSDDETSSAQVGTLTYEGGLAGTLPDYDRPEQYDVFNLFSQPGQVLSVFCQDGIDPCNQFTLELDQILKHLGPYTWVSNGNSNGNSPAALTLDIERTNLACNPTGTPIPCGGLTVTASSLPEPATLALLGLGLVGLGLSRRAWAR